jgi:hypothetical protein
MTDPQKNTKLKRELSVKMMYVNEETVGRKKTKRVQNVTKVRFLGNTRKRANPIRKDAPTQRRRENK